MVYDDAKKDILRKKWKHLQMMISCPLENNVDGKKGKKWGKAPFDLLPTHADDCTQNDDDTDSDSYQK